MSKPARWRNLGSVLPDSYSARVRTGARRICIKRLMNAASSDRLGNEYQKQERRENDQVHEPGKNIGSARTECEKAQKERKYEE
jgi:hypothetical protein